MVIRFEQEVGAGGVGLVGLGKLGFKKMVAGGVDTRLEAGEETGRGGEVGGGGESRRGARVETIKGFEGGRT
eukprot:CAMPEP_0184326454 /NCGR_PEP_ID=MMETSP1049-20130417/142573_1 /TAXON_ID=77928 /ORGANISM="Proteomonas sulcata, Strain CCMP704" /LENGTH=71 /DNA_ID=CAMNT_0026648651 /DNA_START=1027 /DNA_END=1242 /DNA_ORIENTATION=+